MKKLYVILLITFVSASYSQSLNMNLLGTWDDTTIARFNDCWGWEQEGKEYVVMGSSIGSHIFDVSNPSNPIELDRVLGRGSAAVHRDFKKLGNYLYGVSDQSPASLQIMDLSYLPDSVSLVYDEDTLVSQSHNIFIDTVNEVLYSCGGADSSGSKELKAIDISNPIVPVLITDFELDIPWWSGSIGYIHDMYIRDNIAYVNHEEGMAIVDMTNLTLPVLLGDIQSYTDKGYNHSGWLHEDDTTYIMFDETKGKRIKILDVSDPTTIVETDIVETVNAGDTNAIAHNGFFVGDLAFVSYYQDGIYVYDATDMNNVITAGYYTGPATGRTWGVYPYLPSGIIVASDIQKGLYILNLNYSAASVAKNNMTNINVYPNPVQAGDVVNFDKQIEFEVLTISGKSLFGKNKASYLETTGMSSGVYFIKIKNGYTKLIVK